MSVAKADPQPRHILLTGASSGIGFEAACLLQRAGHRLVLPCRDSHTAHTLRERLPGSSQLPICDLADLQSVDRCAAHLLSIGDPIDVLVLNAGLQYSGSSVPRWSAQGFELTIAVNHLAHQALLQRLLPLLKRGSKPRLVVTASEVHNPATPGGRVGPPAGLGNLEGLREGAGSSMINGSQHFDAQKAYKDSKLCNILMAREIDRLFHQSGIDISVVSWSPGLVIPRTNGGFFRHSRLINPLGQSVFAFIVRDLLRITESPQVAGGRLAALATDPLLASTEFQYWSTTVQRPGLLEFGPSEVSSEARSSQLAHDLWSLTSKHLQLALGHKLSSFLTD